MSKRSSSIKNEVKEATEDLAPQMKGSDLSCRPSVWYALFYLVTFASNYYMLEIFLRQRGISAPDAGTFAGPKKFLTHLNHWTQTYYCLYAFLIQLYLLTFGKHAIESARSSHSSTKQQVGGGKISSFLVWLMDRWFLLCCTMATVVGILFWSLFFHDRELILPRGIEAVYPHEMNIYQHGIVAVIMWIELFLVPHRSSWGWDYSVLFSISFSYIVWGYVIFLQLGRFQYPILNQLDFQGHIIFYIGSLVIAFISGLITKKIVDFRWRVATHISHSSKKKK